MSAERDIGTSSVNGENGFAGGAPRGLGIRHLQVLVMAVAALMAYSLRYNLSVAIVAMVQYNTTNAAKPPVPEVATYDWDEKIQGYILSSFFWGYCVSQIPAGMLIQRFGGHRFLCAAIFGSSVLSLLIPQSVYIGGWLLTCFNRMFQGVCQGFVFPSLFSLLGVWAPPSERSKLASIAVSAQLLGTVVATPLSGFLCSSYGWPTVFYSFGSAGLVIVVAMILLGADTPAKHRLISDRERNYIQTSLGGAKPKLPVPWKNILTSVPLLAAIITMSLQTMVYTTFLTKIPTYMATVLKFSMEDNGILSALPHLLSWLLSFVFAWVCDFVTERGWLQLTTARKTFNSIAYFGAASTLIILGYSQDRATCVALLIAFMGFQAGNFVGVQANFVDLAPNFSGTIFSISNFVSAGLSIASPIIVGFIITEPGNADQWRTVFYLSAAALITGNVVYVFFCTAETQKWNWPDGREREVDNDRRRSDYRRSSLMVS